MTSDGWPLVGRTALVDDVVELLADPTCEGVFLVGEPGVGATRVFDEVLDRLRADGARVARSVASPAMQGVAFGAIAPNVPGDLRPGGSALDPLELFERLRFLIGPPRRPRDRFVAAVDDLGWLDDASTGLLGQLVAAGLAVVIATVHADDRLGDALARLEHTAAVRRVMVPRLDRDEMFQMVAGAFDGPVDGTTAQALLAAAQGTPGHLAELVEASIASGSLTRAFGTWTLDGRLTVSPRLAAALDRTLSGLSDRERDLVELIALAEPVSVEALAAHGLLDDAVALEALGLLGTSVSSPATVHLARPLLATQLRQLLPPLKRRSMVPRAIGLLDGHPASDDDDLRLALWRLECGFEVSVRQLERAATIARGRNDFTSTELLAGAATRLEPGLSTSLLRAEALHDLCRFDEAADLLERADELVHDDFGRLRVAVLRHRMLLWGRLDGAASADSLERAIGEMTTPIAIDMACTALANTLVFSGRPGEVDQVAERLTTGNELVDVAMYFPRTIAAMLQGRLDEALGLARVGLERRLAVGREVPLAHAALSELALGLVLVERGEFAEADEVLAAAYQDVVSQHIPQLHTWLAAGRGRSALVSGRLDDARDRFVEARSVAEQARFGTGVRLALSGIATSAGQMGDRATATAAVEAMWALPADEGYFWPARRLGEAWAAHAEGRTDDAVTLLEAGADEAAARGEWLLETECLTEIARLGAATRVHRRIDRAVASGQLVTARVELVRAAAAADPAALAAVEKRFAALGMRLMAAECAAEAGRALEAAGRVRDARGAATRAHQHLQGVHPPATPLLDAGGRHPRLSSREEQIARLAASGLASKVIANQLGLSVRTVSNHLQNAYDKLGVSGRDALRDVLGEPGS